MPRTKKVNSSKPVESKESKIREVLLKKIAEEEKRIMNLLNEHMEQELADLEIRYANIKTKCPLHMLNRTIGEIKSGEVDSSLNSTKSKRNQTLSRTISKRSLSLGCDDEGDRTTRRSRSRAKTATAKPVSRSLSRNTTKKLTAHRTPLNRQPPNQDIGSITPKVKPNTPQMIVRRPKVGEIAWSGQGSPLLTSHTIAAEPIANVNIPLPNGNLVSLLPERGVRVSQIPSIDIDTRRQLEILRDNLIQVCSKYQQEH